MHSSTKALGSAVVLAASASAQLNLGGIVGGVVGTVGGILNPIGGVVTVPILGQGVDLGLADKYAVFAGTNIANTGNTNVNARIGVSPGTGGLLGGGGAAADITGFPPGVSQGQDDNSLAAVLAKADILTAYTTTQLLVGGTDFTGVNLGGRTVGSGAYTSTGDAALTGNLILDAQGNSNAKFIFKIAGNFVVAPGAQIILANGAYGCNIFFQIGDSLTIGTGASFNGVAMVQNDIIAGAGTNVVKGALYSINGAITLNTNMIDANVGACNVNTNTNTGATTTAATTTAATTTAATTKGNNGGTTTVTTTVTNAGSTTTVTSGAFTSTVAPYYASCTSTTTHYQPKYETKTAQPYACNKMIKARAAPNTEYVTSTCAAYTQTHYAGPTHYASVTGTYTRTHWSTYEVPTTYTSTEQPACTNGPMIKRDYLRMFE